MRNFNIKLECKKCKVTAILRDADNGACGDPECCGGLREWVEAVCPKCGMVEEIEGDE